MEAEVDINNEYEKLFGRTKFINLFDTDEEYSTLRQDIISQPRDYIKSCDLPFDDIKLIPYNEYVWKQEIESATNNGKHVFYIKQSQPFCKAACYFDANKGNIVLLRYSYIVNSNSYSNDFSLLSGRRKLLMSKSCQDKHGRYLTENVICSSPLVTASYVLGRNADLTEWHDEKDKTIIAFYSELARLQAQKNKKIETEKEEQNKGRMLFELLNSITNYLTKKANKHFFYIEEDGVCSASGYMEEGSKLFFIQKGSLVSKESDIIYLSSQSGKARLRFLDKACTLKSHYYCVTKDAKCRSASAAACYVLGRKADFTAWKDDKGKSLAEVYPNRFYDATQTESSQLPLFLPSDEPPLFHIVKTDDIKKYCHAFGTYDSTCNQFLILKDSVLSLDVSPSYRYTTADYQRQKFIKLNCIKKDNGFVMKRDALCDSPSAAASFVLGRSANGWIEWKDESSRTLKEVYNH